MKENSKYASSLTYGPREEQILKAIDESDEKKYPSKNEVLRRGLHTFTYIYNANENSQFLLLHTLLESLSKNLDKQTLGLAKDIAFSIQSILVVKYGLAKADSFATIPNTLENLTNALQQENIKQAEVEADVKKTIANLDASLKTVFMKSEQSNSNQFLMSLVGKIQQLQHNSDHNSLGIQPMRNFTAVKKVVKEPTVLVIDDSHIFSQYLAMDMNVVDKKYDNEEILQACKKFKPDVILCNFKQLVNNHFLTLNKIKNFAPYSKIVVITADLTKKINELKALNTTIVYDPFDIPNLKNTIYSLLSNNDKIHAGDSRQIQMLTMQFTPNSERAKSNLRKFERNNLISYGASIVLNDKFLDESYKTEGLYLLFTCEICGSNAYPNVKHPNYLLCKTCGTITRITSELTNEHTKSEKDTEEESDDIKNLTEKLEQAYQYIEEKT